MNVPPTSLRYMPADPSYTLQEALRAWDTHSSEHIVMVEADDVIWNNWIVEAAIIMNIPFIHVEHASTSDHDFSRS